MSFFFLRLPCPDSQANISQPSQENTPATPSKSDSDRLTDLQNIAVISTVCQVLQHLNSDTYQGQYYAFQKQGNTFSVQAKGRGEVLKFDSSEGVIESSLNGEDYKAFAQMQNNLEAVQHENKQPTITPKKEQLEID